MATASRQVEIDLGGRTGTHMRTSPDGQDWSRWSPIRGTPRAELGSGEGSHTLHVQLRDGAGSKSPVFSDCIVLDTSGPQVSAPTVRLRLGPLGTGASGGRRSRLRLAKPRHRRLQPCRGPGRPHRGRLGSQRRGRGARRRLALGRLRRWRCRAERGTRHGRGGPDRRRGPRRRASSRALDAQVTVTARDGVGNATRASSDTWWPPSSRSPATATLTPAWRAGRSASSPAADRTWVEPPSSSTARRSAWSTSTRPWLADPRLVHVVDLEPGVREHRAGADRHQPSPTARAQRSPSTAS